MDRRTFCGAAVAAAFAARAPAAGPQQGRGEGAEREFRLSDRTLTRLGRIAPAVPAFVTDYCRRFEPHVSVWAYEDGVVWVGALALYRATLDAAFLQFVKGDMAMRVGRNGDLPIFRPRPYSLDTINAGKVLLPLFNETGEDRFRKAMDVQFEPLRTFPRTRSGNFWHKQRYPWQVWLDGVYMGHPFQIQYARTTGDKRLFEDTLRQIRTIEKVMRNPATGLYYHGWDESRAQRWANPETGLSPHIWGRAVGWWLCALVDVYELSEGFDPAGRAEIARILRDALDAAMTVRSQAGLWYQVMDLGGRAGNYEEASASFMIVYSLLKAARMGLVDDRALDAGRRSLAACLDRFLTPSSLNSICQVAGLGGDPYRDGSYEYYLSEKIVSDDPKGVGAFFMCLAEALQAQERTGA